MKKILVIIGLYLIYNSVFAADVIPNCVDVSSKNNSRIYSNNTGNTQEFYTHGLSKKVLSLALGECITSEDPGVYKTTLVLKQDGNLINYVYDEQKDTTSIAFASDSASTGVTKAVIYLDSNTSIGTRNSMIELLDANYNVLKQIMPVGSKYTNNALKGSLVLAGIKNPNLIYGLTTYDKANSGLYNYVYIAQPVNYLEVYFDKHTLESRDAQNLLTIHDAPNNAKPIVVSCKFPFTDGDCYGKVKGIGYNHYIFYLENSMTLEIAKLSKIDGSKRSIYLDRLNGIYFSWNDTDQYIIPFANYYPLNNYTTYTWIPSPQGDYSTFRLLSWDDQPTLPDGNYKENCDMASMKFTSGILSGTCFYNDDLGTHSVYSSLNYDLECKKDPLQNDLVATNTGVLICE